MKGTVTRGALALVVVLNLLAASLVSGGSAGRVEASFPVGGLAALPSALPATVPVPGVWQGTSQVLPAVAPASGPGSFAIVDAFCEGGSCPRDRSGNVAPIEFTMSRAFPATGPVSATFTANGAQTLLCRDDATCDLSDLRFEPPAFVQHVAVGLTGGGENEVVNVTACDITGGCRTVQVVFVETFVVVPPVVDASASVPALVAYRCNDVGRYEGKAAPGIVPGGSWSDAVTWEEIFAWFFSGFIASGRLRTPASTLPMDDIPFYSCGGDTSGTRDDRVTIETDWGILSVESLGDVATQGVSVAPGLPPAFRPFGSVTPGCDAGDSVDILDHPGPTVDTRLARPTLIDLPADWCDLDFAPNGVVTYALWGTGQSEVATIRSQQSGGAGVLRSSNVSFTGSAALTLLMEAPESIGMEGGRFSLAVVDGSLRPVGGVTVSCSAEPKDAVLKIVPQTGTTAGVFDANPGQVVFTLFPTRSAVAEGMEVSVTCFVDSDPDKSTGPIGVQIGVAEESLDLLGGCNFVSWTGPEDTEPADLAARVAPADNLGGLWAQGPSLEWKGFAPEFPEVSDMGPVDRLEIVAICMTDTGTFDRPAL